MTRPVDLVPGNVYFRVFYLDEQLTLPDIHTLVFVGREEMDDGEVLWVFEDAASRSDDETDAVERHGIEEDHLSEILDIHGLHATLRELEATARFESPPLHRRRSSEDIRALEAFRHGIDAIVAATPGLSFHVRIRGTDDGFFIEKHGTGWNWSLFTQPLKDPDEDRAVQRVFLDEGIEPSTSYLSSLGRTRVLGYRFEMGEVVLERIMAGLLCNAFGMRDDDELVFRPREATV